MVAKLARVLNVCLDTRVDAMQHGIVCSKTTTKKKRKPQSSRSGSGRWRYEDDAEFKIATLGVKAIRYWVIEVWTMTMTIMASSTDNDSDRDELGIKCQRESYCTENRQRARLCLPKHLPNNLKLSLFHYNYPKYSPNGLAKATSSTWRPRSVHRR